MTESNVPTRTPTGVNPPPASPAPAEGFQPQDSGAPGVQDRVKGATSQAAHSLGDIAHDAKEQASGVAGTATEQIKSLADQARAELGTQAESQQKRAADGLRSLSSELSSMARNSEEPGYATDLVRQASDTTDRVANWLDERDPGSLVRDVQDFARRRPGLFIALAAGAGLLVGRLARGMKDAPSSEARGADTSREKAAESVPTTTYSSPAAPAAPASTAGYGTGTTGSTYGTGTGVTGEHSAGWSAESNVPGPSTQGHTPAHSPLERDVERGDRDV